MITGSEPEGNREQARWAPRVFLSYAHDSDRHKAQVLQFCQLLRDNGIEANLDQYDTNDRRDWYSWMISQVSRADYVLVIASPRYRAVGDGNAPVDHNRGVQAEAALLRDLLYADHPTWTNKLLPVVLPGASIDHIPYFLQPFCASRYLITELSFNGIEDLLRVIAGQTTYPGIGLGDVRDDPRHVRPGERDGPLDVSTSHVDDELLTALSSFDESLADTDEEPELKSLLLSWRLDVEPIAELAAARVPPRSLWRMLWDADFVGIFNRVIRRTTMSTLDPDETLERGLDRASHSLDVVLNYLGPPPDEVGSFSSDPRNSPVGVA
jgi:SEFIR domain